MSLALFTIYLIFRMHGSEAAGGLCKTSERSVPGKALKGHTFKEFAVRAIVDCQNTCENDPRCASYNYYIPDKVCELNSQTKETRPDDFVTDELRFYMRRDGMMYSVSLRCLRLNCLHCTAKAIRYNMIVNNTELSQLDHTHRTSLRGAFGRKASTLNLKISDAQLRSGTKISLKSPFSRVNRSLIRYYGFPVCEKLSAYSVSIVLNVTLLSPILQDVPFYILLEMEY